MALSLTAEQKSIFDLFSGKDQYIIPAYQRPYAWEHKHCRVLFDDLTHAYFHQKDEGYFLGNLVISQNNRDRNSLEVIDGQQRLTTLLLLIKVLLLFDETNDDLKNALDIPSSRRGGETKSRLKTLVFMAKDSDLLQEALALDLAGEGCKGETTENRFKKNICYFYGVTKEFAGRNNIQDFIDFLMFDIYFLPIVTEGDDPDKARKKALKIFETINDRGLNLSTADILKARLYSLALNELKHDDFIEKWKYFEKGCADIDYSIDNIFMIYSLIIKGKEGIRGAEVDLRVFFIEKEYSPFNKKTYGETIDDLLKIIFSIRIIKGICINPRDNEEIKKWIQLVEEFIPHKEYIYVLVAYLFKYEIKNEKIFVSFLKNLTKFMVYSFDNYHFYDAGDYSDKERINELIILIMHGKPIVPLIKEEHTEKIYSVLLEYVEDRGSKGKAIETLLDEIHADHINDRFEYIYGLIKITKLENLYIWVWKLYHYQMVEKITLLYLYLKNDKPVYPYYFHIIDKENKSLNSQTTIDPDLQEFETIVGENIYKINSSMIVNAEKPEDVKEFFKLSLPNHKIDTIEKIGNKSINIHEKNITELYLNIGKSIVTDFPIENKEDLQKISIAEARKLIDEIEKTTSTIEKELIFLKRGRNICKVVNNFLSSLSGEVKK